ncbi:MAG: helix-turn-helix transcriptional regulator [Bacilli bacterium]|nr:helix-turn-helix transcriptional regulator [Bacilli bacterium]
MNQEKIGKLIKEIRQNNNLTQKQFAHKYGVTYQAVSKWENGKNIPDISLLKEISKDYNIDISDLLEGEKKSPSNKSNSLSKRLIFLITVLLAIAIGLILYFNNINKNNFSFKTLSTSCKNFKISGSIAYSKSKSSIYISQIDYCGQDDKTEYSNIECILYEKENEKEQEINKYTYNKDKKITIEKFLKNVRFKVDNYSRICKKYNDHSLYIKLEAKNNDEKTTTYKIPIKVRDDCY